MYNYQSYVKQGKLHKKYQQIRKQYYEDQNHKQKINSSLIQSHKKRIEGFILAMVQKPEPIQIYQDKYYSPRKSTSTPNLHQKTFYHNAHTDKQRIKDIIQKNEICDAVPFNNTFSHKFRDFKDQKKLHPMKYTSVNGSLRVKQTLDSSILNYLPNVENKKIDKLAKNSIISWKEKKYLKQINKSLLPIMHKKTYFQSLKTIYAQCPNGFLKTPQNQKQNLNNKRDQYQQQIQNENSNKKQNKNSGQNFNRKQNCKEALIKCGLLGGKSHAYRIGMQNSSKRTFHNTRQNLRF